ncbi:MAG: helix-turn-helix domain-containing protein [Maricaulaceae bacterium]|jgi:CRP/FNR family transcriptional regulator
MPILDASSRSSAARGRIAVREVEPQAERLDADCQLECRGEPIALPRFYRAKEMVFLEGEPADFAYQVIEGAVRLLRTTADGRRQLVGFACKGEWLAVGSGPSYSHTAETLTDSRLRAMSRAEMDRRMRNDRVFLSNMMDIAASKLHEAEEQMILLGQRSALQKVAAFLVTIARRLDCRGEELYLPMDRADVADYLGLTIETVSRKFTQLKTSGVIALSAPSRVRICHPRALKAIAEGEGALH